MTDKDNEAEFILRYVKTYNSKKIVPVEKARFERIAGEIGMSVPELFNAIVAQRLQER